MVSTICPLSCGRTTAPYLATAGQGRSHHALSETLLALRNYAWEVSNKGGCAKIGIHLHKHRTNVSAWEIPKQGRCAETGIHSHNITPLALPVVLHFAKKLTGPDPTC